MDRRFRQLSAPHYYQHLFPRCEIFRYQFATNSLLIRYQFAAYFDVARSQWRGLKTPHSLHSSSLATGNKGRHHREGAAPGGSAELATTSHPAYCPAATDQHHFDAIQARKESFLPWAHGAFGSFTRCPVMAVPPVDTETSTATESLGSWG